MKHTVHSFIGAVAQVLGAGVLCFFGVIAIGMLIATHFCGPHISH